MADKQNILIVDDEQDLLDLMEYNLKQEGFGVLRAPDGQKGLQLAREHSPSLVMLDIMMPRLNGFEVMERMRKDDKLSSTPVIFLTAREDEQTELEGLRRGGDDYITKPASTARLISRIKAVLRRYETPYMTDKIEVHDLVIDKDRYQVVKGGTQEFTLPRKQFELLYFLADHKGKILDRQTLINNLWSDKIYVMDRTIDVHIRKIRKKIGSDYIETVNGLGYCFKE